MMKDAEMIRGQMRDPNSAFGLKGPGFYGMAAVGYVADRLIKEIEKGTSNG